MSNNQKIIWTKIDEAPALATLSLLPIVQSFTKDSGVDIETWDISLSGRIISLFSEDLNENQHIANYLGKLGKLAKEPEGNIIKLPNISASIPQLQAAIKELQEKGFNIPNYPEDPKDDNERELQKRFSKVLGSAVNPVIREGNSDRRAAVSVKQFAKKFPHKMMKEWPTSGSKSRVVSMNEKDFYGSEKSKTIKDQCDVKIVFENNYGETSTIKDLFPLLSGEVIDTSVMNVAALRKFYKEQIKEAKDDNVLLSLHLKATMMKVSDPIIFGHAVSVYFKEVFDKHADTLKEIGANVNNGFADILDKLNKLPLDKKSEIEADIANIYKTQPQLAMVDSRKGKTNLHVPNDIIIDASMPNVVRDGGKMWNNNDELQDCIAMIPDRCYATIYSEIMEDAKAKGQFNPATMGSVANVGLMAQKAEEYGSHDKTFEASANGIIKVIDASGTTLIEQDVEKGDIFRMSQTKDAAIKDWVKLAVNRATISKTPAIFWLDKKRGHDSEIIKKVNIYLSEYDTNNIDIRVMSPVAAMKFTLERVRKGEDTISVTGNVLRDYLTDLFPILELGTSARMLSIVPLLNGGGLFETGAGGSAPKHVQQFLKEGHLRWDSLGEYCALVPSLEMVAKKYNNNKIAIIAKTLNIAVGKYLENSKTPSRKVNEIDNRGSSFFLAMYWAEALASQTEDSVMQSRFAKMAKDLRSNECKIEDELIKAQGAPVDLGGYYLLDNKLASEAMRPSKTLNAIIDA